jgi:hypothetical protein
VQVEAEEIFGLACTCSRLLALPCAWLPLLSLSRTYASTQTVFHPARRCAGKAAPGECPQPASVAHLRRDREALSQHLGKTPCSPRARVTVPNVSTPVAPIACASVNSSSW